jgi:hypothetical protein
MTSTASNNNKFQVYRDGPPTVPTSSPFVQVVGEEFLGPTTAASYYPTMSRSTSPSSSVDLSINRKNPAVWVDPSHQQRRMQPVPPPYGKLKSMPLDVSLPLSIPLDVSLPLRDKSNCWNVATSSQRHSSSGGKLKSFFEKLKLSQGVHSTMRVLR